MPTERFYRLPEMKRKIIREAAVKEFARVPYEKVSINQIIQKAEISRGSFYTYFEDKDDLLQYIFSDSHEQVLEYCEEELKQNGGDFFRLLEQIFDRFVNRMQETSVMLDVMRNIFSYREGERIISMVSCGQEKVSAENPGLQWIFQHIDRSRFLYKTVEEYEPLMVLGATALMVSIKRFYQFPEEEEKIRKNFQGALELLKHGAYGACESK